MSLFAMVTIALSRQNHASATRWQPTDSRDCHCHCVATPARILQGSGFKAYHLAGWARNRRWSWFKSVRFQAGLDRSKQEGYAWV